MADNLSDEQLADYHARRVGEHGFARTFVATLILTVFAGVVIVPFVYMLMISFKGSGEMGSGRLIPDSLRDFATLGHRSITWLRAELSAEQAAALNRLDEIPMEKLAPGLSLSDYLSTVPEGLPVARRLSLEKPSMESPTVVALLETRDPERRLRGAPSVVLYLPGNVSGTSQTVAARVVPRDLGAMLGRLLANYKSLVNWVDLRSGQVLTWVSTGYPRWYFNSLFVAIATVVLGLFLDSLAGFAFAKYNFPFRTVLFWLLIATLMIPYPVTLVPSFFIFAKLGLYNTFGALILPGVVSAFGIFLVRQYVQHIPDDMLDAGRVDGASDFSLYWHLILPTARPVLAALAVFRFIWQWNSYLYPLVLTNRDSMKTVQLGLASMQDVYGTVDYGLQMAGSTIAVLPILLVYAFMQKHFIAGITLGSVKG